MTSWPQDPGPQHDSAEEATTMTIQQDDLVMADGTVGTDDAMPSASSSRRIGIFIMAVIVVVALVLFGFALAPRSSNATANVTGPRLSADPVGQQAPVFSGTQVMNDQQISLADYKGKTVVVNFWASWCTTCKAEAKVVADVARTWAAKGVVFIGIDTHDTTAGAHTYYQTYGLTYPSVLDPDSRIGATYGVSGLPETYFINTKGEIVDKYISSIDAPTFTQMITKAVAAG
jgi:cytochrome c biogenesis protein CcmG/thiol:disulfide interchange protein DsbE